MVDIIKSVFKDAKILTIEMTQKMKTLDDCIDYFKKIKDDKYNNIGFIIDFENMPSKRCMRALYNAWMNETPQPNAEKLNYILISYNGKTKIMHKEMVNFKSINKFINQKVDEFIECVVCYNSLQNSICCPICLNKICLDCFNKLMDEYHNKLCNSFEEELDVPCPCCRTRLATVC